MGKTNFVKGVGKAMAFKQAISTGKLAAGKLDGEAYRRETLCNCIGTAAGMAGGVLGTFIKPGAGTLAGKVLGDQLASRCARKLLSDT